MRKEDIARTCGRVLNEVFRNGLRTTNVENQPAPWVIVGLQRLEAGGRKRINRKTICRANDTQTFRLLKP